MNRDETERFLRKLWKRYPNTFTRSSFGKSVDIWQGIIAGSYEEAETALEGYIAEGYPRPPYAQQINDRIREKREKGSLTFPDSENDNKAFARMLANDEGMTEEEFDKWSTVALKMYVKTGIFRDARYWKEQMEN
ncbi:MAG: hypothetical protein IJH05_03605 [Firmicutes bacterium]|nr:hypothetical protein [Bacillota bacterium]